MHLIGWQNTWEQAPGVPPPLPRPDGGGNPWPCTCVHGPTSSRHARSSTIGSETSTRTSRCTSTRDWNCQACSYPCQAQKAGTTERWCNRCQAGRRTGADTTNTRRRHNPGGGGCGGCGGGGCCGCCGCCCGVRQLVGKGQHRTSLHTPCAMHMLKY